MLEGDRLRFFYGMESVPESDELISRLGSALDDALARNEEAERRAQAEAERAQAEAKRVARLERELAEAREEIERLRQSKKAGE
jgi:uncharacterized FlaG/YvyC family protein